MYRNNKSFLDYVIMDFRRIYKWGNLQVIFYENFILIDT